MAHFKVHKYYKNGDTITQLYILWGCQVSSKLRDDAIRLIARVPGQVIKSVWEAARRYLFIYFFACVSYIYDAWVGIINVAIRRVD